MAGYTPGNRRSSSSRNTVRKVGQAKAVKNIKRRVRNSSKKT